MRPALRFLGLSLCLTVLAFGCDLGNRLRATRIKDILDQPRNYENKEVTIYGTVVGGASLLLIKYFEIQDDTGTLRVVTDRTLPKNGEKLRVTGRIASIEFGAGRLIVLREKGDGKTG